ncbi:MAG: hypothetical protein SV765_04740 [Pseudomonadota bacterium]|nr:hypothetical protein [Pseudomonadales bacterium]MDY6919503.1 hypothetical protein [Pseudomonadota bacterium]
MRLLLFAPLIMVLMACSGYRMKSNVDPASGDTVTTAYPVRLIAGDLDTPYQVIGPLEVIIRPPSPFHSPPEARHARQGLIRKARQMGANAVIKVTIREEFDIISFGHISASGIAVRVP